MVRIAMAVIGASVAVEVALAGPEDTPSELLAMVGRADFLEHCSACHGASGRGNGPVASSLNKPPTDLTRIAARRDGKFPADEIAAFIDGRTELAAHGSREMPIWGREFASRSGSDAIGDELVRGRHLILVEYLRTIQR